MPCSVAPTRSLPRNTQLSDHGNCLPGLGSGTGVLIHLGWATPRHDISHAPRGDALPPFPLFSRSSYTTPMICSGHDRKRHAAAAFRFGDVSSLGSVTTVTTS